jgi:hypothetical protein
MFLGQQTNQELTEEQLSYIEFMRKPEVIKMHLDILYKNIHFLKKEKIDIMLNEYKSQKLQKQKEAEEQLQIQNQMRKLRGRSGQKKEKGKDENTVEFGASTPVKDKKQTFLHCMNTCMPQDESVRKMFYSETKAQTLNQTIQNTSKILNDSELIGG